MRIPPWTQRLPHDWQALPVRYVANVRNSNVDKKMYEDGLPVQLCNYTDVYYNDYITADLDLMDATATQREVERFELRAGDVIITKDSESWDDIGVAACVPEHLPGVVCGYHLSLLRPQPFMEGRFLLRALQANGVRDQFWLAANGVTRFGLGQDGMKSALIPTPPLSIQCAIADFLDGKTAAIDALIEKKARLVELLVERRAALIHRAVTRGLDAHDHTQESGIPTLDAVPAHWRVVRNKVVMREVVDLSSTGTEELLTVSHITGVTRRAEKDVTMFMAASHVGYKRVQPGDLIINTMWAWMGALGVSNLNGIASPAYGVYRLDQSVLLPDFYDLFYRTSAYVAHMTRYSKGVWSSRLRLYPDSFLALNTIVPPLEEQERIVGHIRNEVGSFDVIIARLGAQIDRLQEYRRALITAAVTGQFDIPEAAA